ncbi:MAG TPA: type II toxin-antitoxin system antitoxin SocA domain-containing protein, partial [Sphaerochaeta sp.]|nr:type II toxin-antitoxin system antitoxin SocA domain-containing protein [Sphaerochaeta sp.]
NYDLSLFKEREQIIIDRVIEKFATKSVSEITTLSHQERAWQELGNRALISYDRWAPELRVIF